MTSLSITYRRESITVPGLDPQRTLTFFGPIQVPVASHVCSLRPPIFQRGLQPAAQLLRRTRVCRLGQAIHL